MSARSLSQQRSEEKETYCASPHNITGRGLGRVDQYKMILKRGLIPTQDDPENGGIGIGVQRPDADTHAERRGPDRAADQGVFEGQRRDRVYRAKPGRGLQLDRANTGGPGIWQARQEAARSDPQLCEQGNRAESAADHAADPELRGDRKSGGQAVPAAPVSEQVYRAGCSSAGRGGWGAPALERAGDAAHSEARIRRVWQGRVWAPGRDLGLALVQPAPQRGLPQAGSGVRADAAQRGVDRRTAEARPTGPAWVPTGGHGTLRRLGW